MIRADEEKEIRASVRFAADNGLKLVIAGGLEAWRCADVLKEKDVAVLLKVERLPSRESDPYDAPYANAAALQRAGVRFAIVSDDSENVRNLPYEAAMAARLRTHRGRRRSARSRFRPPRSSARPTRSARSRRGARRTWCSRPATSSTLARR